MLYEEVLDKLGLLWSPCIWLPLAKSESFVLKSMSIVLLVSLQLDRIVAPTYAYSWIDPLPAYVLILPMLVPLFSNTLFVLPLEVISSFEFVGYKTKPR